MFLKYPKKRLYFHTDLGSQYTSQEFNDQTTMLPLNKLEAPYFNT